MRFARHVFSFAVIAIIALVYFSTTQPVRSAIMDFTGSVIYKGEPRGVALACVVRWDSKLVPNYVETLKENGMCATFFVTAQWAHDNAQAVRLMRDGGNEIALLGTAGDANGVKTEIESAQAALGKDDLPKLYMAANDKDSDRLSRYVAAAGMKTVLSSIDVVQRSTKPDVLAKRAEDAFPGAIIRFEPTKTMLAALPMINERLKSKGYALMTVSELIAKPSA